MHARPIGPLDFRCAICEPFGLDDAIDRTKDDQLRTMPHDVELMRDLMLDLETRQASPRANVVLAIDDQALLLERPEAEITEALVELLDLEYIDGPGLEGTDFFLFRKLTLKGVKFVRAVRRPSDWERLKRHFEQRKIEGTL